MKLLFALLFASFSLSAQFAHSEIREIHTMTEILPQIDGQTLVIFDLDNTLIRPTQLLGSDQWYYYLVQKYQKEGLSEKASIDKALALWITIQNQSKVSAVESLTPGLITELQGRGIKIMGLSARPPEMAARTAEQLKSIGVDLAKTPPIKEYSRKIEKDGSAEWIAGIFYVGATHIKGEELGKFLNETKLRPTKIVFTDDRPNHTKTVNTTLEKMKIPGIEFRYGAADAWVKSFDPALADAEFDHYQKHHEILSDAAAATAMKK